MTERNRFVLLTTILTVIGSLFLNNLYANDLLIDTVRNVIDTTSLNVSAYYNDGHFQELASILPFHDHYLTWDTTTIHPYDYNLANMSDTVTLVLADYDDCAYVAPVAGMVTSKFGPRTDVRYHYGVDIDLNTGDPVSSAFDGIVRISQYSYTYGNCVVVRHYNGLETLYAHLSERSVNPGQSVKAGELVGYGGSTGRSTGPHLHFEMRYKGQPIDPNEIIAFDDGTGALRTDTFEISASDFKPIADFKKAAAAAKYVTIRSGDTLSRIAVKNHTTINRICQINRISRNKILRPGQRLRVR